MARLRFLVPRIEVRILGGMLRPWCNSNMVGCVPTVVGAEPTGLPTLMSNKVMHAVEAREN
jgi:hypothetical protein